MTVTCHLPPIPIGKHCGDLLVMLVQGTQYAGCLSYFFVFFFLKVYTRHATIQYNRALSLHGIDMKFNLYHLNLDKDLFLCGTHPSEHSVTTRLQCFALAARTAMMTEAVL
jgi:hypothetical protein